MMTKKQLTNIFMEAKRNKCDICVELTIPGQDDTEFIINKNKSIENKLEYYLKQFYKKASQVESGYLGLRDQLNELTNALKENNFDEFFQMNSITGKIDDLYNMWISAVDIANKVNAFLDGGLSNKDINDLNKFITISKSSQETRENFEIFCKSLEETNNQLKIFNEEVGKYAANETIQALKDKNEDIITHHIGIFYKITKYKNNCIRILFGIPKMRKCLIIIRSVS